MKKIFISYASKDQAYKEEFELHTALLRRNGLIQSWQMGMIKPNDDWDAEVQTALDEADIVVMLLSSNFFASNYIWEKEFLNTLERRKKGDVALAGIVLSKCGWQDTPLRDIQLISKGRVINECDNRDTAWYEAVQDLKRLL
jgi:internalin A